MNATRPDPMSLFLARLEEARTLIAKIDMHVENHMGVDPELVTWGAAGDAGRMVAALTEINEAFGL